MTPLLRPGDLLILLLAVGAVGLSFRLGWTGQGDSARILARGKLVAELPLSRDRLITVDGPLGTTRIEIHQGRARIAADPSPRQLCVKQGWLNRAGQAALCLPNQVALEILGQRADYDTRHY
jgi:hypothetical protein